MAIGAVLAAAILSSVVPVLAAGTTPAATPASPAAPEASSGATALAGIRERLARPATLRGTFEQEKQLQGFRNPLRSRGTFLLLRERGIAWDTTAPFPSSTVLGRERLVTTLPDGSTRVLELLNPGDVICEIR